MTLFIGVFREEGAKSDIQDPISLRVEWALWPMYVFERSVDEELNRYTDICYKCFALCYFIQTLFFNDL